MMKVQASVIFALLFSSSLVACADKANNGRHRKPFQQQGRVLRDLQVTADACNITHDQLWENDALLNADSVYWSTYESVTLSLSNCDFDAANQVFACTVDGRLDGATEFQQSCIAAGGEVYDVTLDLNCQAMYNGTIVTLLQDAPPLLDCLPISFENSCFDYQQEYYQNMADLRAEAFEQKITEAGYSDVLCTLGDVFPHGDVDDVPIRDDGGQSDNDVEYGQPVGFGESSDATIRGGGFASVAIMVLSIIFGDY